MKAAKFSWMIGIVLTGCSAAINSSFPGSAGDVRPFDIPAPARLSQLVPDGPGYPDPAGLQRDPFLNQGEDDPSPAHLLAPTPRRAASRPPKHRRHSSRNTPEREEDACLNAPRPTGSLGAVMVGADGHRTFVLGGDIYGVGDSVGACWKVRAVKEGGVRFRNVETGRTRFLEFAIHADAPLESAP